MQSTAIQAKARAQSLRSETTESVTAKRDCSEFADPFLQIIMNLFAQSAELNTQQADIVSGITTAVGTSSPNELSALLASSPAGTAMLLNALQNVGSIAENAANLNGLSTTANSTGSENLAALLRAFSIPSGTEINPGKPLSSNTEQASPAANLSAIQAMLGKTADSTGTVALSSAAFGRMTEMLGLSDRHELQSILKNAGIEMVSDESTSIQSRLSEAAIKAKLQPFGNQTQQSDGSGEIDIDALQAQLSKADASAPFELRFKTLETKGDMKVLEQLVDGIKQGLSSGKSEFTIKLKPESLGEITVKLIEEAGKTTLSITAANAETAKLLNRDLEALKQAVAPMNVEVRNVVVAANETANASMHQFSMAGQQFTGQQFAGQQSFYQMSHTVAGTDNQLTEEFYASPQNGYLKTLSPERLDTYI